MEARESIQKDNVSEYSEDFEEEEEEEPVHAVDITPAAATPQRTRTEPARSTKSHPTPQIKRSGPGWKPKSMYTNSLAAMSGLGVSVLTRAVVGPLRYYMIFSLLILPRAQVQGHSQT